MNTRRSRCGLALALLGALASAALLASCGRLTEPKSGMYRAVLELPGGELPFQLEFARDGDAPVLSLINGAERTRVTDVRIVDGTMIAKFPGLENSLTASVERKSFTGEVTMIRKGGIENKIPLHAKFGQTYRFFEKGASDNADVAGRWETIFTEDDGKTYPAVAEFSQQYDQVTGTFLTATGDHHFLAGQVRGDELYLSMFSGAHAFLYKAKVDAHGDLVGEYWSGLHSHERFVAKRNPDAALPEAETTAQRASTLTFTFPDLDGKSVSLSDERFHGKVVLVTLGGSWCGNCHDEAAFLASFYREYHARGFDVVGLMFERFADFPRAAAAAQRFRKQYAIEYPLLVAGISDTEVASNALPQLAPVFAFPTSALLDRHGKIRKIHAGFSGPATGQHFETYKKDFTALVEQLLQEK